MEADRSPRIADLSIEIAAEIRSLVIRGIFSPGLQLHQRNLASQFRASRPSVREALKLLIAEGLVTHDPYRGCFISGLSSSEARQLYRMRHLIETEALSTVVWPDAQKIAAMNCHVDRLEKLITTGRWVEWSEECRCFYLSIFELSRQKILVQQVRRVLSMTDRYEPLCYPDAVLSAIKSERRMVVALAACSLPRLAGVLEEKRDRILNRLLQNLESRGM